MFNTDSSVEEIVEQCPASVEFLRMQGIVCIVCGEPVWGSIGELMLSKGISDENAKKIMSELNKLCTQKN